MLVHVAAGPVTLIISIVSLSRDHRLWFVALLIQSLQLQTLEFARRIWKDNLVFLQVTYKYHPQKTHNLVITTALMFFFLSYSGVYVLYEDQVYFGNFSDSAYTLWYWVTLDVTSSTRIELG
jgi:hypothetical protein